MGKTSETVAFTVRLDPELLRRLKMMSAMQGRPMQAIIEQLLTAYLDGSAPAPAAKKEG